MRFLSLAACMLALSVSPALAGAWTQPQSEAQLIITGSYYSSDSYWNNLGSKQHQPNYTQYALNPYFEYGLTDSLTAGTNLLLERAHQNSATNSYSPHYGLGDSEFFLRQRLWQNNGFVVSAEPMVKLPAPENSHAQPQLGGSSADAGMGLSGGYGFKACGLDHFIDLDTQYRYRFGTPKDQARFNATLGVGVTQRLTIMPQLFTTYRLTSPRNAAFTDSSADDYNLVKLQLSGVYKLGEKTSVQLGVFDNAAGRNAGGGTGIFIAFWEHF